MASSMLLYASDFTYYPRRVLIYLREKNSEPGMITKVPTWFNPERTTESSSDFPPKPPGSIPILAIPNGKGGKFIYVRQSLAILNYLEDLAEDPNSELTASTPSMRGTTPLEKARVTELLALIDECCTTFAYWCVFGASTFAQTTNIAAAQVTKRMLFMRLATVESYMGDRDMSFLDSQFVDSGSQKEGYMQYVTVADCVLMSLLQYGIEWYGRDMTEGLPKLKEFYDRFKKRDSAIVEGGYPEELQKRSSTWQEGTY